MTSSTSARSAGRIFVTGTGGGGGAGGAWTEITGVTGGGNLQGSVRAIITNPTRGSREAYAVTTGGVYHIKDSLAPGATWDRITGNLFNITQQIFGTNLTDTKLRSLTSIVADWRYVIPDDFANPGGATHPVLYVSGDAGVYRSTDDGATWTPFPAPDASIPNRFLNATPTPPGAGGGLPNVEVSDLDIALGDIDPTNGRPRVRNDSPNVLLATTYGRGSFAIRLAPQILPESLGYQLQNNHMFVNGYSQQTAFGNSVSVAILDLTPAVKDGPLADPATAPVVGMGTTDANGRFSIQLFPYANENGQLDNRLEVLGIQATDQAGTKGNTALFRFQPDVAAPDLTDETDTGRPRTPDAIQRDQDNITNVTFPDFQGTIYRDVIALTPGTTVLTPEPSPYATVQLFVNGQPAGTAVADANGDYFITSTVALNEGDNQITVQATDVIGSVGPVSPPLVVTLDTAPPGPTTPDLIDSSDTGPSNTDDDTRDTTPSFSGMAEPFALVQLYVQEVSADPTMPNPLVLAGEAVADDMGNYVVTVGQYVQPLPQNTIDHLDDARYYISVVQTDVAGNRGRETVFGNPGTVVIDGTDANDHGSFNSTTGQNEEGWLYMQKVLENIGPNIANGNKRLTALLGTDPGTFGTQAWRSIKSAFDLSTLPGLGWTIEYVAGTANIDAYLSGQAVNGVRTSTTGILYISTANNAGGDLNAQALQVLNNHAQDIADLVNAGGGLFSQAETSFTFGGGGGTRGPLRLAHGAVPEHHGRRSDRLRQRLHPHARGPGGLPRPLRHRPPGRPLAQLLRRHRRRLLPADDPGHRAGPLGITPHADPDDHRRHRHAADRHHRLDRAGPAEPDRPSGRQRQPRPGRAGLHRRRDQQGRPHERHDAGLRHRRRRGERDPDPPPRRRGGQPAHHDHRRHGDHRRSEPVGQPDHRRGPRLYGPADRPGGERERLRR